MDAMTDTPENQTPDPEKGMRRRVRHRGAKKPSPYDYPGGKVDRVIDILEVSFLATWLWRPRKWAGRGLWRLVDFH